MLPMAGYKDQHMSTDPTIKARLVVTSEQLVPEDLAARLGIPDCRHIRRGDPITKRNPDRKYTTNMCEYPLVEGDPWQVESHVAAVISRYLEDRLDAVAALADEGLAAFIVKVVIYLYDQGDGAISWPNQSLSSSIIERLARCKAEIDFDLYLMDAPDDTA
jgi:hypothetical protein